MFLAVHENFRFQTPLMKVAEAVRSGVIGTPSWARISFRTGYDLYKTQPYFYDEERFIILDLGVHTLDIARVMMGEVERVYCRDADAGIPKVEGRGHRDGAHAPCLGRRIGRRFQLRKPQAA